MSALSEAVESVRAIVRGAGVSPARLHFFGSRVRGEARRGSDLDVVIEATRALSLSDMARLKEAFDDSRLPYRIDVSDYQRLDPDFRAHALAGALTVAVE